MKSYILTSAAFIAGVLLVEGSIITDDDLGMKEVPVLDKNGKPTGKTRMQQVRPPSDAIPANASGMPETVEGAALLAAAATGNDGVGVPLQSTVQPQAKEPEPVAPATGAEDAAAPPAGAGDVAAKAEAPTRRDAAK